MFSLFLVPEGLSAPFVSASIGQPVLIAWTPPESPNGIILSYRVERSEEGSGSANLTTIGTLPGSTPSLVIGDQTTTPFTLYLYRVIAENSAGSEASPFNEFLTLEAGTY
jgi:usherin